VETDFGRDGGKELPLNPSCWVVVFTKYLPDFLVEQSKFFASRDTDYLKSSSVWRMANHPLVSLFAHFDKPQHKTAPWLVFANEKWVFNI
jgi:hypothetical protein